MDFEYISQNVAGPGVDPTELEDTFQGCQCVGECSIESGCSCLVDGKPNFDSSGRFLHPPNSASSAHLECSNNCECALCPERCTNRCVQHGVQFKFKVAKCQGDKGFGVFAAEKIPAGHFVVEYMGELIGREEAERRLARQRVDEQHNYLFTIREFIAGECQFTFIDGRHKGNISRLINHSCEPNLELQVFRLGRPSPSLAMFAARDIQEGEELAYSYGFLTSPSPDDDGTPTLSAKQCFCAAPNCQGRLPSASTI